MDGSAKYELLQKIAGEKIVAFRGRQTPSGQIVLLHQLTGTNDHTAVLRLALQYLLRNPASAGGRILDLVEIQGLPYLVTLDQPECLALHEWLKWELEGAKPAPAFAPQAPAREPGEFTRLFQQQQAGIPAAPEKQAPAQAPAPGEFTQIFGRGGHSQPSEPPPMMSRAPATPPPVASEKPQPGEFSRLFRSPLATPAESPMSSLPAASPSTRAPGEFTRIFGGATPAGSSTPPPAVSHPVPPPVPASTPGPLTESLEPRHAPTSKPEATPLAASAAPGEFTRVIRGPASGAAVPSPTAAPGSPPPAAAPAVQISAPSLPTAPSLPSAPSTPAASPPSLPPPPSVPAVSLAAPPAAAASQAPASGRPPTALIILFAILLVAALALIGFVVLRH